MKKHYDVVAAIIVNDGKILCAKRNKGYFIGRWEFPGGKIEFGETKECALVREIMEELGIRIAIKNHYMDVAFDYQDFTIHLATYVCGGDRNGIILTDHCDIVWKEKHGLNDLQWCDADGIIVDALVKDNDFLRIQS